jgi:hypothetical protein
MFSKSYLQSSILVLFFAFFSLNIFAQEGFGDFVLKTKDGFLLVQNRQKTSFTVDFKGEKIEQVTSDHPNFFIDDKLIQVINVPIANFWKPPAASKIEPTSAQLLEAHKIWESDYLGEALKTKLSVTSENFELVSKRKVMFWSFPMPKTVESPFSHQLFITTVIGGEEIWGINSSPETAEAQKSYRDYITQSMNTLKISSKPFNIKELSETLTNAKPSD